MDRNRVYARTERGRQELAARALPLDVRQRSLLSQIDGQKSVNDLLIRLGTVMDVVETIDTLEHMGLIELPRVAAVITREVAPVNIARNEGWRVVRERAIRSIEGLLGADARDPVQRLEACSSAEEFELSLDKARRLLSVVLGEFAVDALDAQLSAPSEPRPDAITREVPPA